MSRTRYVEKGATEIGREAVATQQFYNFILLSDNSISIHFYDQYFLLQSFIRRMVLLHQNGKLFNDEQCDQNWAIY